MKTIVTAFLTLFTLISLASEPYSGPYRELNGSDSDDVDASITERKSPKSDNGDDDSASSDTLEERFQTRLDHRETDHATMVSLSRLLAGRQQARTGRRMYARLQQTLLNTFSDEHTRVHCQHCSTEMSADIFEKLAFTSCCAKILCTSCVNNQVSWCPFKNLKRCPLCSQCSYTLAGIKHDSWHVGTHAPSEIVSHASAQDDFSQLLQTPPLIEALQKSSDETFKELLNRETELSELWDTLNALASLQRADNDTIQMHARLHRALIQKQASQAKIQCAKCQSKERADIFAKIGFTTECRQPLCYACAERDPAAQECPNCNSATCQTTGVAIDIWQTHSKPVCTKIQSLCYIQ